MLIQHRTACVVMFALAVFVGPLGGRASAQGVYPATPATLGQIPDAEGEVGTNGPPLLVEVPVTGVVGGVTAVSVSMTIAHTWMGEITATLIAPDGTEHVLFGRTRALDPTSWGTDNDINGTFTFVDTAGGNFWSAALNNPMPPGAYRTSLIGGTPTSVGATTAMNPVFSNREPNGTWVVRFTDSARLDVGTVSALSITLNSTGVITPPSPAVPDSYTAGRSTPLVVAAPGVLGNDRNAPGSGALVANLVTPPTRGTLTLNSNGSFVYTPVTGYLGPDSFSYFPSNLAGSAAAATVSITVVPVQPPTQLRVDRVVGNQVTLRWDAPAVGPRPTSYLVEGGTTPGSVMGSVTTGSAPIVTFAAPSGAFFVRVTAIDNEMSSSVSNEVPLYVNVAQAPSAPFGLTGLVNEAALALSWKLTYGGGEPTNVILDVSGATTTSLPIGRSEGFVYNGVPGGTYTFALRATNGAGESVASSPVTLTFPIVCSGAPATPRNFLFYNVGNTAFVVWDPATTGPAATSYVLNVTGSFVGNVPTGPNRSLSTAVPGGSYTVSVQGVNACGASAPTAPQTVVIP